MNKHNTRSIIDVVKTGFGSENKLIVDLPCKKPQLKTHLFKEDYLSDFKSEHEKDKVRNNIGVYSKTEVNIILNDYIKKSDEQNFVSSTTADKVLNYGNFNSLWHL